MIALLCFGSVTLNGALTWENIEVRQEAAVHDESALGVFKFQNTGDSEVEILEIKSSCGCTTTELAQKKYKPGETGEIVALFEFGDRQGVQ